MLPFLNSTNAKIQKQIVGFRGLNLTDRYQDGDMARCMNLSFRRFPYLSTRRARSTYGNYSGATAMTARDKLVIVQGTGQVDENGVEIANLLYGDDVVGQVTAGEKQFAAVNTKIVIWPDKVYLDLNPASMELKPLGASTGGTGATFTADSMTVGGWLMPEGSWLDLTKVFSVGDTVTVGGCTTNAGNNIDVTIKELTATSIKAGKDVFTAGSETGTITLERKIPDMDFICESENRLWGCSSEAQTIYASALGDPTNFFTYSGVDTDSWAVPVGSEGDFTGCCKLASSVLFWKETKLHKVLGSYPSEYSAYSYDIEGLQKGCHKSLQIINEVLYYVGLHGVYTYAGNIPSLISAELGDRVMNNAVAGTDGDSYYLSGTYEEDRTTFGTTLVYDIQNRMWTQEDEGFVKDFARIGKDLYFLTHGYVYLAESREDESELKGMSWIAQFCPFYETIQGRKRYTRILLRMELPEGSWMRAAVRMDGGNKWMECRRLYGKKADVVQVQVPINRCDRFELELRGQGPCTILGMILEYQVGSDV